MEGEVDPDAGRVADSDASAADPRDRFDELRERIRSGDLPHSECDQLDQLVFLIALADRRADQAVRDFPGEIAVQRALSAEAWTRVATQLHVMLGHSCCTRSVRGAAEARAVAAWGRALGADPLTCRLGGLPRRGGTGAGGPVARGVRPQTSPPELRCFKPAIAESGFAALGAATSDPAAAKDLPSGGGSPQCLMVVVTCGGRCDQ